MNLEICDNAVDDDMDGFIDLNDTDCICELLEFTSLIPNHSFEEKGCCPFEHRQLHCATGWINVSHPNLDYVNTCDWLGWNGMLDEEDYPVPLPFPDGEGAAGFRDGRVPTTSNETFPNWKSYAGACLSSPLRAGITYRIEFDIGFVNMEVSPDIDITLFGTNDCDNFPFDFNSPTLMGCPSKNVTWNSLGHSIVSGDGQNKWVKSFIDVTPAEDILAVVLGPPCAPTEAVNNTYYYLDNLLLEDVKHFDLRISEESQRCESDFSLSVKSFPFISYQWYLDGVALIGETSAKLAMTYGEGDYQVQAIDAGSCTLSENYRLIRPLISVSKQKTICEGDVYEFGSQSLSQSGSYVEIVNDVNGCDSMITLDLEVLEIKVDTVNAQVYRGTEIVIGEQTWNKEGDFLINMKSTNGCDSLIFLRLDYLDVYFPNVFSPNQDGYNDTFTVLAEQGQVLSVDLQIYNRWGEMIFSGPEWNGEYNGEIVSQSVFIYLARVEMEDGSEQLISGEVTVFN